MRTYDDKLQGASKLHRFAVWSLVVSAASTGMLVYLAMHDGRTSKTMIHAILVSAGVTAVAYLLTGYAANQVSYLADRAFLTRLFMASGLKRSRAEQMANLKATRGGGR